MWKAQKGRSGVNVNISASGIHSGDAGILVTCDKGQEVKCLREMSDLLSEVCITTTGVHVRELTWNSTSRMTPDLKKEIKEVSPHLARCRLSVKILRPRSGWSSIPSRLPLLESPLSLS